MNLDYSVDQLRELVGADLKGAQHLPADFKVRNVVIDTRNPAISNQSLFVALSGSKEDGHKYLEIFAAKGGKIALVTREISSLDICQLVVKDALVALQTIAENHRSKFKIPVIAITGSNGKTIVKEWLYQTLKDSFSVVRSPKSYNSQIGVALSLLEIAPEHTLGIFEAGISKPDEMEKLEKMIRPTIGVFTGIGDAHSANFSSADQKRAEKLKLFTKVEKLFDDVTSPTFAIPFSDEASHKNASLVQQTALYLGLSESTIKEKFASLTPISMRLEQIEGKNNCLLLNDAYSSDLQSLEIALKQLKGITKYPKKILFLTPFEDNQNSQIDASLAHLISSDIVDKVIFIGDRNHLPKLDVQTELFESADSFLKIDPAFENSTILFKGSRKYGLEKIVQSLAEKTRDKTRDQLCSHPQ